MRKKKVKCPYPDSRLPGSTENVMGSFRRREFLRSLAGAGAAAVLASQTATSDIVGTVAITKPVLAVSGGAPQAPGPAARMVSPDIDDLHKPWCYLAHSTTVLGMPWMPDAVQVTYDGAIFTRHAELCFFYGQPLQPVMQRQKHWLEGWIPIVQYDWRDGESAYQVEMFGAILEGFNEANTLQFIRVHIGSDGSKARSAAFAAATRMAGDQWRFGDVPFSPDWIYEIREGVVYRSGAFVYSFSTEGVQREAVAGHPYEARFAGGTYSVNQRTPVCLARYAPVLAPGERTEFVFKMPRVPTQDSAYIQAAQAADYGDYRERTVRFWQELLSKTNRITVTAEPLIGQAHRATAVHTLLATRTTEGRRLQTDGLPYPEEFLASIPEYGRVYDTFGLPDYTRANVRVCREKLQPDGMFLDVNLVHGRKDLSSHGQTMAFLLNHALMSQDTAYAREIWPMIRPAVDLIRRDHEQEPHGLMRASWPYDAEMIKGQYTCHNLYALYGLRLAIRVAHLLGESDEAESWLKLHDDYQGSLLKALDASAASDGYVPTGLYEFITGEASREGFHEYQTDQDYENVMLAWPCEALAPSDRRVAGTVDRLRHTKYREGIMTYRNGQHLHHYITVNSAVQDAVAGRDRQALIDTYHILLHCGGTFEGFENLVVPWTDRDTDPTCPPPHGWSVAKINGLLRNLFLIEFGGRCGVDEGQRDLMVFNVISPAWAQPGQQIAVEDARTEFGMISASMHFRADGADVSLKTSFHHQPRNLVFHVPYFVELVTFATDAQRSSREGSSVRVSPEATRVRFTWRDMPEAHRRTTQDILLAYRREPGFWKGKRSEMPVPPKGFLSAEEEALPPAPLSFEAVRDAWRREYGRRLAEFVSAGGKPSTVTAPDL
jgi:hypothetical protein